MWLEKRCTRCDLIKSWQEFYKDYSAKSELTAWCKVCTKVYRQERNAVFKKRQVDDLVSIKVAEYIRAAEERAIRRYGPPPEL
jgi:hypothetical protein